MENQFLKVYFLKSNDVKRDYIILKTLLIYLFNVPLKRITRAKLSVYE